VSDIPQNKFARGLLYGLFLSLIFWTVLLLAVLVPLSAAI